MQLIIPGSGLEAGSDEAKLASLPGYAGVRGVDEDNPKDMADEIIDHKTLDLP